MPSKKPQFVIRAEKEVFEKIAYIAKDHERTTTQEIVYLIKQAIKAYEKEHGEIEIPKNQTLKEAVAENMEYVKDPKKSVGKKLKGSFKNGFDYKMKN